MVRTVKKKYQVWLAGYYDDFNGARAIADFNNTPTTTYTHLNSHYGNPLNGEAFLNPRYRWSVEEREQDSNAGNKISTTANNKLQNDGIFEWLTFDDTRLENDDWEGRIQLQYPDGHVANRYKFNADNAYGSYFYHRFINGHDSNGSYIVPVGDNDSSFGRADMKRYDETNYEAKNAGKTSTTGDFVQRAHLTGVWMGEQLAQADISVNAPTQLFAEVTSPSKQPFLCVQTVRKNNHQHGISGNEGKYPTIVYDGALNSRLDGDVFTTRIAVRGFAASSSMATWSDMKVVFEIGYPTAQAGILTDEGYTGIPAIEQTLNLESYVGASGNLSYDTQGLLTSSNSWSYTNDNSWLDVDFVFDYTNTKYDWYVNGVKQNSTPENMNAGTTAAGIYGYQITMGSDNTTDNQYGYVSYLMLDRAGLVRYLTDDYTSSDEALVNKLTVKQSTNNISNCVVSMWDDPSLTSGARGNVATDYLLSLRSLFVSSSPVDWNLLVFGDTDKRIDRPIWRGVIDSFNITQKGRSRELTLKALDSMEGLNKQIPLWDVGQKADRETGDSTQYWEYDAQGFRDSMYLGGGKLKLLNADVGFDKNSNYLETSTQRTQLGSGHPIQMYNNENANVGPNNIEDSYEGVGILGFTEKGIADTNSTIVTNTKTIAILSNDSHGISDGDTISIQNTTNHNDTTVTVESVSGVEITIDDAQLAYTPESAKIVFMGRDSFVSGADSFVNDDGTTNDAGESDGIMYAGLTAWDDFIEHHPVASDYDNSTGPHTMKIVFDSDPNLKIGDTFYANRRNINHQIPSSTFTFWSGQFKVKNITKFRNYYTGLTNNPSILWMIDTYSYGVNNTTDFGNMQSSGGLLVGNNRYQWSKDKGMVSGVYTTNGAKVNHRAIHARWMRDLPQSLWFQYHFGKVKERPLNYKPPIGQTGSITSTQALGYSKIIYQTQGDITPTTTMLAVDEGAYTTALSSGGIGELWFAPRVNGTGENWFKATEYQEKFIYQSKLAIDTTGNGSADSWFLIGVKYLNYTYKETGASDYTIDGQIGRLFVKLADIDTDYKHLWLLWSDMRNNGLANADASTRKQKFGLQYPISDNYEFDLFYIDQVNENGEIDKFASLKAGDDLRIWNLDATTDPCSKGAYSKPVDYSNSQQCTIAEVSTTTLRVTDNSHGLAVGDYFYLYNTLAHDGHYKITAVTTNTFDVAGAWATPSTVDAGKVFPNANSGTTISPRVYYAPVTGSHKDLSTYQDWEDKAGSFLVIDSSPFFNLNTHANGGKTGQKAGGNTDLTDYVATVEGRPALIDNYWADATATYQTFDDDLLQHPNQDKLISDAQLSPYGFTKGDVGITVNDATKFDDSGIGILKVVYDQNNNEDDTVEYFFTWENKLETEYNNSGANNTPSYVTFENIPCVKIINAGETHYASGLRAGMMLKRTDGTSGAITTHTIIRVGDETGSNEEGSNSDTTLLISRNNGDVNSTQTVTWATDDTYTVPVQLGRTRVISADTFTGDTSWKGKSLEEREEDILNAFSIDIYNWASLGVPVSYSTDPTDEDAPSAFEVHATITSSFMLRLMMHVNGFYESLNGGTFWTSDKMRFLWNASIMDTWLPSAKVGCIFDINNVPITSMMTTYNDTSSNDSYGSVVDSRGKSLGNIIKQLTSKTGHGTTNSIPVSFSYLVGRDNRIEVRPKYNTGVSFNRNNMLISQMSAQVSGQITNVRVYYNNSLSFVDYPATNLTDTTRWKILERPKITSSKEALIVAQKQFNTYKNTALKMDITPLMPSGDEDKMIESGRYGYISDPYIALRGTNDTVANVGNWTYLGTGGALFPGMVNALNGNMSTDTDPIKTRYGISKETGTGDITWNNNYYWYGSNSISHALQIVHIPNNIPMTNGNGHSLRIWIDLKSPQTGKDIDNAEFTVNITDYNFESNFTHTGTPAGENSSTTKDVKHSGYYEIDVPASYHTAQGKIIFSFNAEYCRSLLRHRCGDPDATAEVAGVANTPIILQRVALNPNTIFPLGKKQYSEMGGGFRNQRLDWYAPRIQICRDLSYVPASYVSVTDLGFEMSNETMVIQQVEWGASTGIDTLKLTLERDEALSSNKLKDFLLDSDNDGLQSGVGVGGSLINPPINDRPIKPGDNKPSEDADPTQDQSTGDPLEDIGDGYDTDPIVTANRISKGMHGMIRGRMNLPKESMAGDGKFSILGQQKPSIVPSSMKAIEGMDVDIVATSGTASKTADGYVFSGKGLQGGDYKVASQEVSLETTFIVPNDILSNRMSIDATVTHSPLAPSGNKTAVLYVTITNEQANVTKTNTVKINTGVSNKVLHILPEMAVKGLNKAGNKIKVRITRKPGTGDDDADATSVVLKNLNVKMQRAAINTSSSASKFTIG